MEPIWRKQYCVIKGHKTGSKRTGKLYFSQEYVIHEIINLSYIDVEIQCRLSEYQAFISHVKLITSVSLTDYNMSDAIFNMGIKVCNVLLLM